MALVGAAGTAEVRDLASMVSGHWCLSDLSNHDVMQVVTKTKEVASND